MIPVPSTLITPEFLKWWSDCDDAGGTGNQGAPAMFQFVRRLSNWMSLPTKAESKLSPRPIRFGSTSASSKPVPVSRTASKPSRKKSSARPQMERLEGRATPAHLGGIDIRMGMNDSPLVFQTPDWLAQPIHRSSETAFLTMGSLCPPNGEPGATRMAAAPSATSPQALDALLFAKPQEFTHPAEGFTLSRDELFQTGEWGSENNKRDLFASWTGAHGNLFGNNLVTHGARTPDALLMASLAVVGVPLLSMSEKPEEHWEEVLPKRKPNRKKGKPSLR